MIEENGVIIFEIETSAWLKNSYMYIPARMKQFFPDDCFIPRGTSKENAHLVNERGIKITYQGTNETSTCLLELRSSGVFRPSERGFIARFYSVNSARVGDTINIVRTAPRHFHVSLVGSIQR